jgi:hypothetical protein
MNPTLVSAIHLGVFLICLSALVVIERCSRRFSSQG